MVSISFCRLQQLADKDVGACLQLLPDFMQSEILRFKYFSDKKASLLARLMLCHEITEDGAADLLRRWQRSKHNKPFIDGWKSFSISHSCDYVVFATARHTIGIDIEKKQELDYAELTHNFHPAEQEYIQSSRNTADAFYEIWTKKEAVLKATGTGITTGLKSFYCTGNHTRYNNTTWQLYPVAIHDDYKTILASPYEQEMIRLRKFHPDSLNPLYENCFTDR